MLFQTFNSEAHLILMLNLRKMNHIEMMPLMKNPNAVKSG
jgi:hypothetical protein